MVHRLGREPPSGASQKTGDVQQEIFAEPISLVVAKSVRLKETAPNDGLQEPVADARAPPAADIARDECGGSQPSASWQRMSREHRFTLRRVVFRTEQQVIGDDVRIMKLAEGYQRRDTMRREAVVSIEQCNPVAPRHGQPVVARARRTTIGGVAQQVDPPVLLGDTRHDVRCRITGSVIDDQNFATRFGLGERRFNRSGNGSFRIVRGHDDRYPNLGRLRRIMSRTHSLMNTSNGQSNIAMNAGLNRNPLGSSWIRSVSWER